MGDLITSASPSVPTRTFHAARPPHQKPYPDASPISNRMERTRHSDADASADRTDVKYYLPGTTSGSREPGPVGQLLSVVFRRRGGFLATRR